MSDKLNAALSLAQQGHRVFPLAINGKVPALDGNWQKLASTDPDRIRALWTCPVFGDPIDYNVGIAIGPHTVVIDVDVRDGKRGAESLRLWEAIEGEFPDTPEVTTASGGRHLYFESEMSGRFPAKLADGIDIKDFGDYVVGPGSEIDGKFYVDRGIGAAGPDKGDRPADAVRHAAARELAPLPDSVRRCAGERPPRSRERSAQPNDLLVDLDTDGAVQRAAEWLKGAAPEAVEGAGGDRTTFEVAAKVGDFGVSEGQCLDLMLEHWNDRCSPPWDADELAVKVGNAYQYRQNPQGSASAEADFGDVSAEVEASEQARKEQRKLEPPPPPKRRGLHYVMWPDAKPDLDRPFLIDDVIDAGTMVVTYGDSNAGKTYVVLDQAFCVAAGRDWNGHKTHTGLVVYVAAEGGGGFARRIEAFRRHYGATDIPFALVPCPIDLQSEQADTNRLVRLIREIEEATGQKCVLIVVDTLARAMSGGDENTALDMGKFVGHCDRLRAAIGAAVNVIHHTGKDASRGARGSSALRAATDTEIEVGGGQVAIKKQRDMAAGKPATFRLQSVDVGKRQDGKTITACVVEWIAESEFDTRVSDQARAFMVVLEGLIADKMDTEEPDKTDIGVTWQAWETAGKKCLNGLRGKPVARSVLFRLRLELSQSGLISRNKQNQWVICELSQQSQ